MTEPGCATFCLLGSVCALDLCTHWRAGQPAHRIASPAVAVRVSSSRLPTIGARKPPACTCCACKRPDRNTSPPSRSQAGHGLSREPSQHAEAAAALDALQAGGGLHAASSAGAGAGTGAPLGSLGSMASMASMAASAEEREALEEGLEGLEGGLLAVLRCCVCTVRVVVGYRQAYGVADELAYMRVCYTAAFQRMIRRSARTTQRHATRITKVGGRGAGG